MVRKAPAILLITLFWTNWSFLMRPVRGDLSVDHSWHLYVRTGTEAEVCLVHAFDGVA